VPQDAVVLFCGPLAEHGWARFSDENNVNISMAGSDLVGLNILRANGVSEDEIKWWSREAFQFLSNPTVQQQIDRLAQALVERTTLTADEARTSAGFEAPILPGDHA
jgi:hypothetical protein